MNRFAIPRMQSRPVDQGPLGSEGLLSRQTVPIAPKGRFVESRIEPISRRGPQPLEQHSAPALVDPQMPTHRGGEVKTDIGF